MIQAGKPIIKFLVGIVAFCVLVLSKNIISDLALLIHLFPDTLFGL